MTARRERDLAGPTVRTGQLQQHLLGAPHARGRVSLEAVGDLDADPVDELVLQHFTEFEGKKLKSAGKGAMELGTEEEAAELRGLIDVFNQLHPETLRIADECHRKVAEALAGPSRRGAANGRRGKTAAA